MKRIAAMALLLTATLASGQWPGEKLSLLDPFGTPAGNHSLTYNGRSQTVYVGGDASDSLLVIDAERCKAVARVGVGGGVRAMGYNPVENKLYCAYVDADTVAVLDGTSLQILACVGVGDTAGTFCYDSLDNKMYVGDWGSGSVTVIDCRSDEVVATVGYCGGAEDAPYGMCFVPAHRRLYVTSRSDSAVVAIDCSADTVLARIPVGREPLSLCYNPTNDRVCCACRGGTVCGIDAVSNRVDTVITREYGAMLACDPARNVLLVPDNHMLKVVDCSADTVLSEVELPGGAADLVLYDPISDKIHIVHDYPGG